MWKEFRHTGYWVNHKGQVYSPNRVWLKPYPRGNGYLGVDILGKKYLLHRVVAEAFIPNPHNYEIVNHIDGNKHNCSLENIEWTDRRGNQLHAYATGLQKRKTSSSNVNAKPVIMMNNNLQELMIFSTLTEAASFVGVKAIGNIAKCCRGEREHVKGFRWKFA